MLRLVRPQGVPSMLRADQWAKAYSSPLHQSAQVFRLHSTDSAISPRVTDPSIWSSFVPKFMRRSSRKSTTKKRKDWNPATFFIIIFILIGSQSIRIIAEQRHILAYSRKSEAKIELLGKVIESLKRGEDVDVEKMLGSGDEVKEREWEEVIKEIESDNSIWHSHARREDRKKQEKREKERAAQELDELDASPINKFAELDSNQKPPGNFY